MSIQTGLRIRWPPTVEAAADTDKPPSLTALLTHVTHALAQADVCVDVFVGCSPGAPGDERAIVCLPTNASAAAAALKQIDVLVDEVPLVLAWLTESMLSVACACEVLQTANVRIDLACLIRTDRGQGQQVAFLCDDAELADRLLWAMSY